MDWSGERYVRVYCRDTGDLVAIGWEARALFYELLRKCNSAGLLDMAEPALIAQVVRIPCDVVERSLARLLARGMVEKVDESHLLVRNFTAAQWAGANAAARKRKQRSRERDLAKLNELNESQRVLENFAPPDPTQVVETTSADVTTGHNRSHAVTCHSIQSIYRGVRASDARFSSDSLSSALPDRDLERKKPIASEVEASANAIDPGPKKSERKKNENNRVATATLNAPVADPDGSGGDRERDRKARERKRQAREVASRFVTYLNRVAGRRHRVTERVEKRVARLLREGHEPDDFKLAVDSRWRDWQGTEFERFMAPSTILRLDKFAEYVEAASAETSRNSTERPKTAAEMLPGMRILR